MLFDPEGSADVTDRNEPNGEYDMELTRMRRRELLLELGIVPMFGRGELLLLNDETAGLARI